jgi:hypothetical protein
MRCGQELSELAQVQLTRLQKSAKSRLRCAQHLHKAIAMRRVRYGGTDDPSNELIAVANAGLTGNLRLQNALAQREWGQGAPNVVKLQPPRLSLPWLWLHRAGLVVFPQRHWYRIR